jgi:hypothetical protein
MEILLSPLTGSADPALLTDTARLRQALMNQKLGIFADVIVYDLIGQVAHHVTQVVYPTDLVPGRDLEEQVNTFMSWKVYEQSEINYSWSNLNETAKAKLLYWDFRNDRGRPVAKGAYLMRAFFRNSLIAAEEKDRKGRYEAFNGPVIHK